MMRYLTIILLLILSNDTFSQIKVLTKDDGYKISVYCSSNDIEEKNSFLNIIHLFIAKSYPKVDYPIYLIGWFNQNLQYSVAFDNIYGNSLSIDNEYLNQRIEEDSLNIPSIYITINPDDLVSSVKVIEFGIKNRNKLKESFDKLREKIDKGESLTYDDEETIVIKQDVIQKSLSKESSKKVKCFLGKYLK